MTTGQMLFMAGAVLLVLTAVLAVVFLIRRPKYVPESAALEGSAGGTRPFRSGYPTDPLTIRRDTRRGAEGRATEKLDEAEKLAGTAVLESTEVLAATDVLDPAKQPDETEKLDLS